MVREVILDHSYNLIKNLNQMEYDTSCLTIPSEYTI